MDALIDNIARILAAERSRRRAMRLLGGAFAAAMFGTIASQPAEAQSKPPCRKNQTLCGGGATAVCCGPNTCCNPAKGNAGNRCCAKGECSCVNGTCSPSVNNKCPNNCTVCS